MAYVDRYGRRKPPVSVHPLFPAIVALWFAALFGIGTLVLPPILIERAITLAGIDTLAPAAAPPHGVTARITIAAATALLGALLGFTLARRLARAQTPSRPARHGQRHDEYRRYHDDGARRPISVRDELGDTAIDEPAAATQGRRRSLAMAEDDRPSAFLQPAPLPGEACDYAPAGPVAPPPAPAIETLAQHQAAMRDAAPVAQPAEPLDLSGFQQADAPQFQPAGSIAGELSSLRNRAVADPAAGPDHRPFARPVPAGFDPLAPLRAPGPSDEPDGEDEHFPFGAAAFRPAPPRQPPAGAPAEPERFTAPAHAEAEPAFAPAQAEPEVLVFSAPSQARMAQAAQPGPAETPRPEMTAAPAVEPEPLEHIGMVELAERLARSLARANPGFASAPAGLAAALGQQLAGSAAASGQPASTPGPEPLPETAANGHAAAEAPRPFDRPGGQSAPPPPVIPEALRPIPFALEEFGEDEDDLDLELSFIRPAPAAAPPPGSQVFNAGPSAEAGTSGEDEDGDEAEEPVDDSIGYSSLLALRSPFRGRAENVRIEMPEPSGAAVEPAVVFPGQAPPAIPVGGGARAVDAEAMASPVRRFDGPGKVAELEAAAPMPPRIDRDEAERALRSALATLQRMSGAA